jgi:hypothetical protein
MLLLEMPYHLLHPHRLVVSILASDLLQIANLLSEESEIITCSGNNC